MIYIYMICYAKISIVIVSIFQIPKKNHKVKNHFESILSLLCYLRLAPLQTSVFLSTPARPPRSHYSQTPSRRYTPSLFLRKHSKIPHSHPTSTIPCKICELPPSPQIRILLIDLLRFSPPNSNEEEEGEKEGGGGGGERRRET